MIALLRVLEHLVTTPGRILVWLRWALPTDLNHHDDAFRDSRLWHWLFSAGVYVCFYRFIDFGIRRGLFDAAAANLSAAFAGR